MNNVPLDDGLVEDEDEDQDDDLDQDGAMDVDGDDNIEGDDSAHEENEGEGVTDFFANLQPAIPEKTKSKRKKTKVAALIRKKIEGALERTDLLEKRARQCDETDFLKLLHALNSEGIHFA